MRLHTRPHDDPVSKGSSEQAEDYRIMAGSTVAGRCPPLESNIWGILEELWRMVKRHSAYLRKPR
jgi:hypothetical protein